MAVTYFELNTQESVHTYLCVLILVASIGVFIFLMISACLVRRRQESKIRATIMEEFGIDDFEDYDKDKLIQSLVLYLIDSKKQQKKLKSEFEYLEMDKATQQKERKDLQQKILKLEK